MRLALAVAFAFVLLPSCATIVGESEDFLQITTTPAGAAVVITDENGSEVWRGVSPSEVHLKSGDGYFDGATYHVTATLEGYQPGSYTIDSSLCMWYLLGNVVFGGLIGWFVVDPATGAMWDLPEHLSTLALAPIAASPALKQQVTP